MLISLLLALIVNVLVWDYFLKRHRNTIFRQSKISGPSAFPLVGCSLQVVTVKPETIIDYIGSCFRKYGKTFRLWILNEAQIYTTDVKLYEAILSSTTLLQKGDIYNLFRPWLRDGLLLSVGKKWHGRRKIFTPAFHFKVLEYQVRVFDEQSHIMAKKLTPLADGKTVIDIFTKVCLAALDVVTETAMGVKVNAQSDPEFPYVKALKSVVYIQPSRIMKFNHRYDWMFRLTAPHIYRKMMQGISTMHDFTIKVIEERRETLERSIADGSYKPLSDGDVSIGTKQKMALLDILLQSNIDGKTLTNEEICEEVDTFMFEGDDTTTSAVSHALYQIARHPHVQEKLFKEIVQIIGTDKDASITLQQLQDLKYMECVVKETLRLHPSVPAIGRKTQKDIELEGTHIPANTSIYLVMFWSQRDPNHFPEPELFKPERFEENLSIDSKRNTFAYIPFSAGPRNCIGQKFAVLEMKAMISKMIRFYELLPLGPNVEHMMNFILRSSVGMNIGLKPRTY